MGERHGRNPQVGPKRPDLGRANRGHGRHQAAAIDDGADCAGALGRWGAGALSSTLHPRTAANLTGRRARYVFIVTGVGTRDHRGHHPRAFEPARDRCAADTRDRRAASHDGAPAKNHIAITASKTKQPNDEVSMNGQIGLAKK